MNDYGATQRQNLTTVLGATGKTGRRVADRLEKAGAAVRRASRSSSWTFDWGHRDTWAPVLAGATSLYVSYQPDLIVPSALDDIASITALAEAHGVERVVLLAGRGEPEAIAAGEVVHASAMDSTVLACAWFDQNFTEGAFADEIAAGSLTVPVGAVGEPFIDADDIADVAVAVLFGGSSTTVERTYDLTGPRLLTFADVARELATVFGRHIEFTAVSLDDYGVFLAEAGLPAAEIDLLLELFGTLFDGRNAHVSGDVERILGRPPRDVRQCLRDAGRDRFSAVGTTGAGDR